MNMLKRHALGISLSYRTVYVQLGAHVEFRAG